MISDNMVTNACATTEQSAVAWGQWSKIGAGTGVMRVVLVHGTWYIDDSIQRCVQACTEL